ncbi:hypothetical protein [Streptomyces sp.]|nr:hypothetical protein [Streptomyces sp.]
MVVLGLEQRRGGARLGAVGPGDVEGDEVALAGVLNGLLAGPSS